MTALQVRRVDPADTVRLVDWWRVRQAFADELPGHPPVCRTWTVESLRNPWPDERPECFLAMLGGEVVAYLATELHLQENRDVLGMDLSVLAAHRRRGYGDQLLAFAQDYARAHGCTRLLTEMPTDGPGMQWWRHHGGRPVLVERHSRLELATVDEAAHERLWAEACRHSVGYSVVQWVGPTPGEYLSGRAAVEERFEADIPLQDLVWEPEKLGVDFMRRRDELVTAAGATHLTSIAVHDATGEVVGLTTLCRFDTVPDHVDQWQTMVLGEHRGHRLGIRLKLANLRLAMRRYPEARWHDTFNADSNEPMLAVNEALGFVPVRSWAECELVVRT